MSRYRNKRLYIQVTEDEKNDILQKMEKAKMTNLNEFVRRALSTSEIINLDLKKLQDLTYELNKIGTNINQIAKVANQTNSIYKNDLDEIKKYLKGIEDFVSALWEKADTIKEVI